MMNHLQTERRLLKRSRPPTVERPGAKAEPELAEPEVSVTAAGLLNLHASEPESAVSDPARPAWPVDVDDARPVHCWWKGTLERIAAGALLVPGWPIMILLVALVRCTSAGPGFYHQERVGYRGRRYNIIKIRTMVQDAEKSSGAVWSKKGDSRITTIGRFLRRTHLDELPQLINIVRGEMSFVGPRPERPQFVADLAKAIPEYLNRLEVLPGVTGLAQVRWPPDESVNCVKRKLASDLEYAKCMGLWFDLRLIACTAAQMIGIPRSFTLRCLGLNPPAAQIALEQHSLPLQDAHEDAVLVSSQPRPSRRRARVKVKPR